MLPVTTVTRTCCTSVLVRLGTLLQFKFDRIERLLETRDDSDRLDWIDDSLFLLFS